MHILSCTDFATPGKSNAYGIRPSESNYVAPGKRPLSSMSPTMVFLPKGKTPSTVYHNRSVAECDEDNCNELGDIVLILGASGGPKIISAVLQTIINYCILGMPLFESVVSPRVHDQVRMGCNIFLYYYFLPGSQEYLFFSSQVIVSWCCSHNVRNGAICIWPYD
jgi:gamma-glutamyltranspeptidase